MNRTLAVILAGILAITGAGILLRSPFLALESAGSWLRSISSVSGETYSAVLEGLMGSYRSLGLVLLAGAIVLLLRLGPKDK